MNDRDQVVGKTMLLPHACKAVGFAVAAVAAAAITMVVCFAIKGLLDKETGMIVHKHTMSLLVAGLFMAAMSRDRQEDEMLRSMRLAAFFAAFGFCVLRVALDPLLAVFGMPEITAMGAVIAALGFYHGIFIIMKRRARREKHD